MIWLFVVGVYFLIAFLYFIYAMNGGEGTNDFLDGILLTPIYLLIAALVFMSAFFSVLHTVFFKKTEKPWMKDDHYANR